MGQSRIFGLQQFRRDPQRFHFFADPDQFLFLLPDNVVRVFHGEGPCFKIQVLFRLWELMYAKSACMETCRRCTLAPESHRGENGLIGL